MIILTISDVLDSMYQSDWDFVGSSSRGGCPGGVGGVSTYSHE